MNDPAPLPDLVPPLPRELRVRTGRGYLLSWSGRITWWILTTTGIFCLLASLLLPTLHVAGIVFGMTVTGHIAKKSIRPLSRVTHYSVAYSFTIDERTYDADTAVDLDTYKLVRIGDPVQVRVLPCCPTQGPRVLESGFGTPYGIWVFLLGSLLFNAFLTESCWIPLYRLWRQRELVKLGTTTIGWVVRKEVVNGLRTTYQIHYRFRLETEYRHATMSVQREDYDAAQIDEAVTVMYDPAKPDRSVIYRFAEHEAIG